MKESSFPGVGISGLFHVGVEVVPHGTGKHHTLIDGGRDPGIMIDGTIPELHAEHGSHGIVAHLLDQGGIYRFKIAIVHIFSFV